MDLIGQIFIPFATAFLGAFAGWFFKRHRLERENVQLDKANEAQDITNFGAAVETWQKLVAALDHQIVKLLAQSKEDSNRISELTQEVYNLRQQVDQLQKQLARYRNEGAGNTGAWRSSLRWLILPLLMSLSACRPDCGKWRQGKVFNEGSQHYSAPFVYVLAYRPVPVLHETNFY